MNDCELKKNLSSEPYVSSYTFRYYSDYGWMAPDDDTRYISQLPNGFDAKTVAPGSKIYIATRNIDGFFDKVDPMLQVPYTLISSRNDRGICDKVAERITDKVQRWYCHNNTSSHERVTTIPLGLQNKHWRYHDHPQSNSDLINSVASEDIPVSKEVLLSFEIKTNRRERRPCYDYFKDKKFVTVRNFAHENKIDYPFVTGYFREIRRHKFVVCPFGNGYDCHRNWETWSLGGIPIIKKHKSMKAFYDMPAWFVRDWSEVTEKSIEQKYVRMKYAWEMYNHKKKYWRYWRETIWGEEFE